MTHHHLTYRRTLSGKLSLLILTLFSLTLSQFALAQASAKVVLIKNQVTVESSSKAASPISRGADIQVGDIIRTGKDARAIIRFNDGSVFTLGADTEMKITAFSSTEQQKKGAFEFVKGAFRIVTGAITKTESPDFTVHTPIGSIGVRGTDFWGGNLSDDNSVDVVLLESEHTLEIKNPYGTAILKEPKQGTTLVSGKAPLSARIWPEEKLQRAFKTVATE